MSKTSKTWMSFYGVLCLIELFNIQFFPENRIYSKPMLMPALLLFTLSLNNFKLTKIPLLITALFFAWLGDLALMTNYKFSFMAGLSAFLVMHLIYIYLFNKQRSIGIHKHLRSILSISIFIIGCIWFFWNKTDDLQIPVSIYCLVIGAMGLFALMRWKSKYYWNIVIGSLLFMASDLLIAIDKFYMPFDASNMLVMLTYVVAQFLIIHGYLKGLK